MKDHNYKQSRTYVQTSKKKSCGALIRVRDIVRIPAVKVSQLLFHMRVAVLLPGEYVLQNNICDG